MCIKRCRAALVPLSVPASVATSSSPWWCGGIGKTAPCYAVRYTLLASTLLPPYAPHVHTHL